MELSSDSAERTRELGACLGRLVEPGDVIVLTGDLGAGKTVFTKGLAAGLGVVDNVTSPTFVILHQLDGRIPLYHLDLYRLEDPREFAELGFEDVLYGDGVSVLEWGDKFPGQLPSERLELIFEITGDESRKIVVRPVGKRWERLSEEWRRNC